MHIGTHTHTLQLPRLPPRLIDVRDLPVQLVYHIFSFLDRQDYTQVSMVCRLWYLLTRGQRVPTQEIRSRTTVREVGTTANKDTTGVAECVCCFFVFLFALFVRIFSSSFWKPCWYCMWVFLLSFAHRFPFGEGYTHFLACVHSSFRLSISLSLSLSIAHLLPCCHILTLLAVGGCILRTFPAHVGQ
jgi:F-box-like